MAVKKAGELWSQQRCIFVIPWDVAGLQGLDPLESSEGLQTRAPPQQHGTALSPALGHLLWTRSGEGVPNSV